MGFWDSWSALKLNAIMRFLTLIILAAVGAFSIPSEGEDQAEQLQLTLENMSQGS